MQITGPRETRNQEAARRAIIAIVAIVAIIIILVEFHIYNAP